MMHSGASVVLVKQWDIVEFRWTFFSLLGYRANIALCGKLVMLYNPKVT
jgi:hypothetical protein